MLLKFTKAFGIGLLASLFVLMNHEIGFCAKSALARLPVWTQGSPATGNEKAPVTIVEFTDFQCPFCRSVQPALKEVLKRYPNEVRLVFKNFPLRFHHQAREAHLAALCADEQHKFWEYRDRLFGNQNALKKKDLTRYAQEVGLFIEQFKTCVDKEKFASKIENDFKEGVDLGIEGTPSFLINGRPLMGAQPFSVFQQIIEDELAKAGSNSKKSSETS